MIISLLSLVSVEEVEDTVGDQPLKPLVCFEIERNELRQLLIDWVKKEVESDGWVTTGTSRDSCCC
jgi:hypothetical protein